jgi:hypothetical protein
MAFRKLMLLQKRIIKMNIKTIVKIFIVAIISLPMTSNINAAEHVFYETDFEDGKLETGIGKPVWSLHLDQEIGNTEGIGNFFTVVTGNAHSGTRSLQFNYTGRNAFCNSCGGRIATMAAGSFGTNVFVDAGEANLATDPFNADNGRFIYNKTDGYSKWEIVGSPVDENASGDRLNLVLDTAGINGATNTFSPGDTVSIERQCGVDGIVADNKDRRRDCNEVINYFVNPNLTTRPQKPGESLYRRVYVKLDISASATLGSLPFAQKLRYWTDDNNKTIYLVVRSTTSTGTIVPRIESLKGLGGPDGDVIFSDIEMIPNTWYYIQEQFKAQTEDGKNDGEYRLWFAKSGEETITPVYEIAGISLSIVSRPSMWGNFQHLRPGDDPTTSWYIDDIKISNVSIGPTAADGSKVHPPKAPIISP